MNNERFACGVILILGLWGAAVVAREATGQPPAANETKANSSAQPNQGSKSPSESAPVESVRPGINDRFLDPELKVDEWLGRFEVESREVYAARKERISLDLARSS